MSAVKSGLSLRTLALTPERIPDFLIPSRSPLRRLSPRLHPGSPEWTRLLSDHDDSPGLSPPLTPPSPGSSRPFLLRLPRPPRVRRPRCPVADADTDVTTRAAMSLPHVGKVTTPYGFRAVLAMSPRTCRRESLFHQNKPVFTVTDSDQLDPRDLKDLPPPPGPRRSPLVSLRPIKALGLQVLKELKKPASALSPAARKPRP